MELRGKVALITGASRGIGRALSLALADSGCGVLLTALEGGELAALAQVLADRPSDRAPRRAIVATKPSDLTDPSQRRALVDWVRAHDPPIDILVNNAGGGRFERFDASSWEEIGRTLALNVEAPTHLTRALLPDLKSRPEARIVIVSSGIARLPYPGLAVYGAAKGYLSSLSESLACELRGTSVGVLCVHPGFTATHFMGSAAMDMSRVPRAAVHTPERVAARIVRALERDEPWIFTDAGSRLGAALAGLLPGRLRTRVFQDLFWRVPS